MQGPHKASTPTPQPAPAASIAPPLAHPADSAISYVMQTTPPAPAAESGLLSQWTPSLFALGGVFATLGITWLAEAKKRRQDTKKELYLKAADAIHEGGVLLGSFSNMDIPLPTLAGRFAECIAPLNKAEVVAKNALVRAMIELKNKSGEGYGELVRIRMWAEPHVQKLQVNAPLIKQTQAEIDAILAEQKRMNIEGINTPEANERFQRLQNFYTFFSGQLQSYFEQDNASRAAIQPVIKKAAEAASKYAGELSAFRVKVIVLMRRELEFGWWFDEAAYRTLQEDMAAKALKELELIMEEARQVWAPPTNQQEPLPAPPPASPPHAG